MTFAQRVGIAGLLFITVLLLIEIVQRLAVSTNMASEVAGIMLWIVAFALALAIISPNEGE